jgi:shikimate kinase
MNIVLIGARGSGKSAVSSAIATITGRNVYSTDTEVERRSGCTIRELVAARGWEAFRQIESDVVRDFGTLDNAVIDTGGGIVVRPENVAALKANGRLFWLQAPVETMAGRIGNDTNRPSLTGAKSFVDEIAEVLEVRAPLYAAAADSIIDTADRTPESIAREILSRLADLL